MQYFTNDKVRVTTEIIKESSERNFLAIPELFYIETQGYKNPEERAIPDESWKKLSRSDRLCGKDKHFWLYTKVQTPQLKDDEVIELNIATGQVGSWDASNPQGILYLNNIATQGVDLNHRRILLQANKEYEILFYLYLGAQEISTEVHFDLLIKNKAIEKLYYDLKVPYDAALCFEETDYAHIVTMKHLEVACNILDLKQIGSQAFLDSVKEADDYLHREYYEKECGKSDVVVNYVGHTHIDVAWLWTLAQTREKTQRSFATVLNLMDQYPDYVFMSSQPQLYAYLKEEEPTLYEKVKQRVKEGRWEVEGAMWLEADCNLTSGESLIRQILFGKRFMKEEFGVDSHILWLPDVFGYSAALPQILQKSGVDTFVTSKISWNETNKMPYDSFLWEGIDGSSIFTYFLTSQPRSWKNAAQTRYNGFVNPDSHIGTWERFQQKEYSNETLVSFGYGDGGGGPTADMLETEQRLSYGLPGMPKAKMGFAGTFLERFKRNFYENCELLGRTPKWVGELYLELHRGTYTSMAKNKKNNRKCEFLCQITEMLSVANNLLLNEAYPNEALKNSWQILLLNQFHDIIPGSSIYEVYEESDKQYAEVQETIGGILYDKIGSLASNVAEKGIFVYNPNSFTVSSYAEVEGNLIYAREIPPLGWKVISETNTLNEVCVGDKSIDTPHYRILFNDKMNIISIFDKDYGREVLEKEQEGNKLILYEDYPKEFDNWEISSYYKQKSWNLDNVSKVEAICGNGFGGFKITREYGKSVVIQKVLAYTESRRIDFKTEADWHEHHVLLKAAFPVDIHSNYATYETQFGYIERPNHENTSWDMAKFEVCAHKWCDLSEDGYGVSILNDCKYGHSILGNQMTITLLKCGTYPNPQADQGHHYFTYSLLPHQNDYKRGGTIEEAYLLNKPLIACNTDGGEFLPDSYSLFSTDCENIVIETVKQAEDGDGVVVRLYDAWNRKSSPVLRLGFESKEIFLCDMLENNIKKIGSGNAVKLDVKNFEIITLKIR